MRSLQRGEVKWPSGAAEYPPQEPHKPQDQLVNSINSVNSLRSAKDISARLPVLWIPPPQVHKIQGTEEVVLRSVRFANWDPALASGCKIWATAMEHRGINYRGNLCKSMCNNII